MGGFLDPNKSPVEVFPMYGMGHLVLLLAVVSIVPLMAWQKPLVTRLRQSRRFMAGLAVFMLLGEAQAYAVRFIFHYEPFFERLPFHLCGSLAIVLPILILVERYDVIRFLAGWSIAAGLISFLNLGTTYNGPATLYFYHYVWRHAFLFLFPVFLFISGDFEIRYRDYVKSTAALVVYSALIFLVNWLLNTNYLYIGPANDMAVPFLPDSLLVWPLIYPSFLVVGLVLFHLIYAGFAIAQHRRRRLQT